MAKAGKSFDVKVYPNPVVDNVYISGSGVDFNIMLMDAQGREVPARIVRMEETCSIDMQDFASGLYYIMIIRDGQQVITPILKQ